MSKWVLRRKVLSEIQLKCTNEEFCQCLFFYAFHLPLKWTLKEGFFSPPKQNSTGGTIGEEDVGGGGGQEFPKGKVPFQEFPQKSVIKSPQKCYKIPPKSVVSLIGYGI